MSKSTKSFLGTGWSFPPKFSLGGGEVAMVSDEDDIHQSLSILLGTRLGERIMAEAYGCDVHSLVFEEVDQALVNRLKNLFTQAILKYEPRIELLGIEINSSQNEAGLLLISISYAVRGTNSRFNYVYPFFIKEAQGYNPLQV